MIRTRRSRLLAMGLAGLMAVGLVGAASVAVAQVPGGEEGQHHRRPGKLVWAGIKNIIQASGIAGETFREGHKNGKSINTVLAENGVDSAVVQAQVLADLDARLDAAVLDGSMTQEQADRLYAGAVERLPQLLDRTPTPGERPPKHRVKAFKLGLREVLQASGLPAATFKEGFAAGKSINTVLTENGLNPATVQAAALAAFNERLAAAVVEGKISQEDADRAAAHAAEGLAAFMDHVPVAGEGGRRVPKTN
ncbi:MAG: hypothetical protein ACR2HN_05480 [Tepidiformaceae bacterium]